MWQRWTLWQKLEMIFFAGPIGVTTIAGGLLTIVWFFFFLLGIGSGHHGTRHNARRASCQSNLKQIAFALQQYSVDYEDKLPLVTFRNSESTPFGWADAISPYLKSDEVFQCPSEDNNGQDNPRENHFTDYWINTRLGGKDAAQLRSRLTLIFLGEGNDGTDASNATYNKSTLPRAWVKDLNSPATRHLEGGNYAFADGHVKWFKPSRIKEVTPNENSPAFAVR